MKTIRTYQKACDFCNCTGWVKNPEFDGMTIKTNTMLCPVCHGNKTILVTEEFDSPSPEIPEISDEEIENHFLIEEPRGYGCSYYKGLVEGAKWYRTKLREGGKKDE